MIAPGGQLTDLSAVQRIRRGTQCGRQRAHVWPDEHSVHVLIARRTCPPTTWVSSGCVEHFRPDRPQPHPHPAGAAILPGGRGGPADHLLAQVGPLHPADSSGGGRAPGAGNG
ncbi:hypothetical protein GCM10009610_64390 [Pseudonocardia xinjiangensis]